MERINEEDAIVAAEKLAAASDVAIVVAGLTPDWESEGFDRPSLQLPGRQDELVTRVACANPNTIVVIQAVSAVCVFHASTIVLIYSYLGICCINALG